MKLVLFSKTANKMSNDIEFDENKPLNEIIERYITPVVALMISDEKKMKAILETPFFITMKEAAE